MIPIARPDVGEEEIEAVAEVLRSGMLAQGRRVAELEEAFAALVGVKHCVAVSNGTAALMAILAGLRIGPGDEVITVGHTFAATVNAILAAGARPVFVDVEPDTYLIDATQIEAVITARTRAIMPVHLFGLVADMDAILGIADRHGLAVVEDACQAHGATYAGRVAGSFGHGAFSLYATKNMTSAEGGLITTDDDGLADWLRLYRNQGMRARYQFEILGFNLRMTDVAAAIGLVQLEKLARNTERRRTIAAEYAAALAELPVGLPVTPDGRTHVFHQFTIDVGAERDAILADIRQAGVGAEVYYPEPVHRLRHVVEQGLDGHLPVTEQLAATTLSLPMHPGLRDDEVQRVVDAVTHAVEGRTPASDALAAGSSGGRPA